MTATGATPSFVPPHLAGKVSDFRNEPGDKVSFDHPDAYLGLSPDKSRVVLNKDQYKNTFDRDYRLSNMEDAVSGQYSLRRPRSGAQQIQDKVTGAIRGAYDWGTSSQGRSIGTAGLLSALLAGGLGTYLGRRNGSSGIGKGLLFALLGGGLGAAATAYGQNMHNKRESRLAKSASMEVTQALITAVHNDYMLNQPEKVQLLKGMAEMQAHDRDALYRLIRVSIGAGAGAIIGRFLKAKGLLPTLVGGIVGAMLGGSSGPRPSYNRMGQLSMTNYLQ